MKKTITNTKVLIITTSIFLFSCGGEAPVEDITRIDTTSHEEVESFEDLFESDELDYYLPSPLQVASIFKKSGLAYNSGATHSPDQASQYTDQLKQMLNFGIYSADMAYCVLNNQSNESRKYLDVITTLAEKIGMEAVFENSDLVERFDQNVDNQDSIEILMIDIHERTEEYMDANDMQHQSAIHFAGAWTEGMYLGVYDFENNNEKEGLGAKITEQMSILGNIIKGLKDPKNDGIDIGWLITDLEKIENTYNNFESVEKYFNSNSQEDIQLTKEEYDTIGKMIKDLRIKITQA